MGGGRDGNFEGQTGGGSWERGAVDIIESKNCPNLSDLKKSWRINLILFID